MGLAAGVEGISFKSVDNEATARRQTLDLLRAYMASLSDEESRPLAVETALETVLVDPATGENLGIPLFGVMDLVLDEGGPTICDFKTAARSSDMLEITHEVQLTSYAWLFRSASPVPGTALEIRSLIKTKTPQIQCHRYAARTDQHFARLFALIRSYLDDLDRGRFVYRPGLGCSMCDHRDAHCAAWTG